MAESKDESEPMKKLPKFSSLDELVTFFEENDLGDYDLPEVHFDVNVKRRVPIDRDLYPKLDEAAHARGLSVPDLVNAWMREKITAGG